MIQEQIHRGIIANCKKVEDWFCEKRRGIYFPIYSSYDMRDAGFKVANVDANIYPAGFNNICPADKTSADEKVDEYLKLHYGNSVNKLVLITEEHTNNPFYWDNVATLKGLIEKTGREVRLALPKNGDEVLQVKSHSGQDLLVYMANRKDGGVQIGDFTPDLLISNNDFSKSYEEWAQGLTTPMNPPRELGWYQRKKDAYFQYYNRVATEFAELIGVDPWSLQVETKKFENFDLQDEDSIKKLSHTVEEMLSHLRSDYQKRQIEGEPFVFVKNNSGTYGLAVIQVKSAQEVLDWNYKSRKKMKAAKGGRDVQEVIVQEGIPTILKHEASTAEPTIYMIGFELAGGFLRTHGEKGPDESLNSPGAVYKKLCVSDLKVKSTGCPMENVYGWVARLSALAVGLETQSMGITYANYKRECE